MTANLNDSPAHHFKILNDELNNSPFKGYIVPRFDKTQRKVSLDVLRSMRFENKKKAFPGVYDRLCGLAHEVGESYKRNMGRFILTSDPDTDFKMTYASQWTGEENGVEKS